MVRSNPIIIATRMENSIILMGSLGGLIAGLATAFGAALVFLIRNLSEKLEDLLLGAASGVMLAASFFSLLLPGIDEATAQMGGDELKGIMVVTIAFLMGAGLIWLINETVPHDHFVMGHEGGDAGQLRKIWLFILAIAIHNFPEGLAIGVAYGKGATAGGIPVTIGISLQDIPEGLAVALALVSQGYSRKKGFLIGAYTGMIEPVGSFLGAAAVSVFSPILAWGLCFSAGAMIFIISHEIVPETHRRGHHNRATGGLLAGFVIMMILDVVLG